MSILKYRIILTGLILSIAPIDSTASEVRAIKRCDAKAAANIREAVRFIGDNLSILKHEFKLAKRRGQRRRIRRRMDRKIGKLRFSCAERVLCRPSAPRVALHAFGIAGNKIRLCYDKMLNRGYDFCAFTGIVAHEFGHTIGIPKDRLGRHHRNRNDRVYQFGFFVRDLCIRQGRNRALE